MRLMQRIRKLRKMFKLNSITRRPWLYLVLMFVAIWVVTFWISKSPNSSWTSRKASTFTQRGCRDGMIRGVNLGGWLLLEPWITPSIFEEVNIDQYSGKIVDEWSYYNYVNDVFARDRLNRHWDEFIQKEDLLRLANSGITHLRIPVPYWMMTIFPNDPLPEPDDSEKSGKRFYLKRLAKWCEEIGIRIIIDLHGAPGSQNGMDHSGKRGRPNWNNNQNVDRTLEVLELLLEMIAAWITEGIDRETFYGISVINEPLGSDNAIRKKLLEDFYPRCYKLVRQKFGNDLKVIIDYAFMDVSHFRNYMSNFDGYEGVILDIHRYHSFGPFWNDMAENPLLRIRSWQVHQKMACDFHKTISKSDLPTYIGEWSLAVTDCQKYIHGGFSLNYVPPDASPDACSYYNGNFQSYSDDYKNFLSQFMVSQIQGYESSDNSWGWFFWTAKTERHLAPEWDYLFLLDNQIAPRDLCNITKPVCRKIQF